MDFNTAASVFGFPLILGGMLLYGLFFQTKPPWPRRTPRQKRIVVYFALGCLLFVAVLIWWGLHTYNLPDNEQLRG